ncbi:ComF family protein [Dysgonomonas sp. 520]|uniref:ComF family protein n=1 Tax=Dysgonomonas sp. 520 TaxID=2302931 RepID=UPI0013D525CF|nr:ComF family protein [Dysgonomonas sp. 520]NDW08787.1 ComF family protein [Dysgonomonas sp. 520]
MKNIFNSLLNLFFPPMCVACEKYLSDGEKFLCLNCLEKLPKTNFYKQADNSVEQLLAGRVPFIRIASHIYFEKGGMLQPIVHELKYKSNPDLGIWLGKLCGKDLQNTLFLKTIDYIVPVPLHPKRERKRGYNQSFLLSQGLSSQTGIPINDQAIERIVNNKSQTSKSKTERIENVSGIFSLKETAGLVGKHFLLVDDLLTTGATLEECAKTILQIPESKISIFTLGCAK